MNASDIAAKVRDLLTGEPLRAINYGAIAVVYLVLKVEVLTGRIVDPPDMDGIAIAVTAAIAAITEVVRRFTYSPNSVNEIVDDLLTPDEPEPEVGNEPVV